MKYFEKILEENSAGKCFFFGEKVHYVLFIRPFLACNDVRNGIELGNTTHVVFLCFFTYASLNVKNTFMTNHSHNIKLEFLALYIDNIC